MKIFVSSVQNELAEERRAVRTFIESDPLLRRFFTVFLFEYLPASDRRTDAVYLAEVERSDVYLGIFAMNMALRISREFPPRNGNSIMPRQPANPG